MTLPKESMRENLYYLRLGKDFLEGTKMQKKTNPKNKPKKNNIKEQIDRMGIINIKNICSLKTL